MSRLQAAMAQIKADVIQAMEKLGDRVVQDTKQSLSNPGPAHSPPGEPPNRQTGELMEGIEKTITSDSSSITLTISSSRTNPDSDSNIPADLEFGHNLVTKTHTPARRVPLAVFPNLAPLGPGAGVHPVTGASTGSVVERPYMRPQMDKLAGSGLSEVAGYMQSSETDGTPAATT